MRFAASAFISVTLLFFALCLFMTLEAMQEMDRQVPLMDEIDTKVG